MSSIITKPVERRTFLRNSLTGAVGVGLAGFGVSFVGMLYPGAATGFGSRITVPGNVEDIYDQIVAARAPFEYNPARSYLIAFDPSISGVEKEYPFAQAILDDKRAIMALNYKCVHLGCKVPWCQTSQWFECPCHGSKYNRWGEWTGGPAPRGLDRFPTEIVDGSIVIDTGVLQSGPSRTANVLKQDPEGPNCI